MPKIKSHKSTTKRFRRTKGGKGKLMKTKIGKSHFKRRKTSRVKAQFDQKLEVEDKGTQKRVQKLAPYLKK